MNRSERTYSQLFDLLRDTPQTASYSPEEIQSLIEGPVAPARGSARFSRRPIVRHVAIVAALALSAAGVWQWQSAAPQSDRTPAPPQRVADKGTHTAPENTVSAPQPVTQAKTALTADARDVRKNQPAAVTRPGRAHISSPPAARQTATRAANGADNDARARTATKQSEASTIPMLELSQGELQALGVTFVNGGIQTIGEEYYTLANEQDRRKFAQMGMDTAHRTGIVQMRLVIDTFGLTTRAHQWTRVETYSRIAPVIALNSYVKDEHQEAVALNSFTHSPIMDSAKRSIRYAVDVFAKMLTSDNVDRVMHDSDQTNPARILVPVHIRLGDEAIHGSTKRRGADVILWYYPTPEFVGALPARYRISLQKELNAIADVVECNLPPGEACRQMTGELSLLNYCKRTSGALRALNVSPNPARGSVMVRYMVESERTIATTLYGIHGEYIRELVPAVKVGMGTHSTRVQLGSVAPGAYVVVVRSEHGEQVSERLIVQ